MVSQSNTWHLESFDFGGLESIHLQSYCLYLVDSIDFGNQNQWNRKLMSAVALIPLILDPESMESRTDFQCGFDSIDFIDFGTLDCGTLRLGPKINEIDEICHF